MNNPVPDAVRRRLLITSLATAVGAPLLYAMPGRRVRAATLLRLAEGDPAAEALQYHKTASKAPRTKKAGTPAEKQFCYNCRFVQAEDGEWRPCQIFPAKAVHENGWCAAWMPKS